MKASVIVLSWNGMNYLQDCLDAVLSQGFADLEPIVVDNASTDGSADFVASHYPGVRLLRNERNLGFAAGNNRGLRVATGDVLLLLNQDTVVQRGWLKALAEALMRNPRWGIVGGKALYPDGRIQHAGGYVDAQGNGFHYGYRQDDTGQFEQMHEVDFVTGATLAISRAAFEAVGELDEGFAPVYWEDVDWCYRVRAAGFQVVYVPQAVLVHKEASMAARESHEGMYGLHRNRLRFVLKHWPAGRFVDEFLPAERAWLEGLGEGGESLVAAVHHAYLYHLLHLDELVRWRVGALGTSLEDADTLASVLLTLRTIVPLNPPGMALEGGASAESVHQAWTDALAELQQCSSIREQPARSKIPLVGWLLTTLRGPWNRAVTAAYVLPMVHQQVEFNTRVVTLLNQLLRGLEAVHAEYLGENGRELGELANEIRRLQTSIERINATNKDGSLGTPGTPSQ